jgi:hypothetical protein
MASNIAIGLDLLSNRIPVEGPRISQEQQVGGAYELCEVKIDLLRRGVFIKVFLNIAFTLTMTQSFA